MLNFYIPYCYFSNYLFFIFFSFLIMIFFILFVEISYKHDSCKNLNSSNYYIYQLLILLAFFSLVYIYTIIIFYKFDRDYSGFQLVYNLDINENSLYFALDSISVLFLLLTSFILPICVIVHYSYNLRVVYELDSSKLSLLESSLKSSRLFVLSVSSIFIILFIFFSTLDLFIFFISFESSVIPLFILIANYGSRVQNKVKASLYIFFFTVISSLSFLFALFLIYFTCGSLNLLLLSFTIFTSDLQKIIWICLFIPIASKIPIIPFHIWLPEAHVEAPTEGSVLLASLMLKLGAYFLLRFLLPLFPIGTKFFIPVSYSLFSLGLIYTSSLIFNQVDLKKIIAYSSISHMNLALIGLFSGSFQGIQGSVFMFFTHGIISSGLFICIGWLYSRYYTRIISNYRGLTFFLPVLSSFFFIFILGNLSFPGTGSFISEFLIILGVFQKNAFLALLCLFSSFLCTIYSFYIFTRIFFGSPSFFKYKLRHNLKIPTIPDKLILNSYFLEINSSVVFNLLKSEYYLLLFLSVYTIISGIFPNIYLNFIRSNILYIYLLLN